MPTRHHLEHPVFHDEVYARDVLERLRWPNGVECPHAGCSSRNVARVGGTKQSHRAGLFNCKECRRQFTATVGTVLHRSKVPLTKWMQVLYLEDNADLAEGSSHMAEVTGLAHKTIEKMRARIYSA